MNPTCNAGGSARSDRGRTEEDIYEVVWTDAETIAACRTDSRRLPISPRYQVLSQIGTGGTGIVYKVRDLETDEIVALKVHKPEIASDPDVQENFKGNCVWRAKSRTRMFAGS